MADRQHWVFKGMVASRKPISVMPHPLREVRWSHLFGQVGFPSYSIPLLAILAVKVIESRICEW